MQGIGIGRRMNRHTLDTEFTTRPHDTKGDLFLNMQDFLLEKHATKTDLG